MISITHPFGFAQGRLFSRSARKGRAPGFESCCGRGLQTVFWGSSGGFTSNRCCLASRSLQISSISLPRRTGSCSSAARAQRCTQRSGFRFGRALVPIFKLRSGRGFRGLVSYAARLSWVNPFSRRTSVTNLFLTRLACSPRADRSAARIVCNSPALRVATACWQSSRILSSSRLVGMPVPQGHFIHESAVCAIPHILYFRGKKSGASGVCGWPSAKSSARGEFIL